MIIKYPYPKKILVKHVVDKIEPLHKPEMHESPESDGLNIARLTIEY